MNNHTDYIQIANQLHNLTLYNQLYEQMNKFPVLQQIFLNQCQKSQTLLFAACQILSKKLINRQLLISADDIDNNKKFILFKISSKLYQFILTSNNTLPNHIIRSCINTISLCINASIYSTTGFDEGFVNYMRIIVPDFKPNQLFIHPHQIALSFVQPSPTNLDFHHQYAIMIFSSLLDYIINSTYSQNYYYFRRNLYAFKNQYLVYLLNYSIFCIKSVFKTTIGQFHGSVLPVFQSIRPALKLFQTVVTYPLSVTVHEAEVEDQIHQNISGLQTQIYFPSCFRNLFCDTGLLMDIIGYYSKLNFQAPTLQLVRQDLYSLIRIIGRVLSTSQYVFASQQQKKAFRSISIEFITTILKQNKFFDTYLILCITKINVKFMSIQNDDQMFEGKRQYFKALALFICNGVTKSEGKIQDGDKHPYRQLFQVLNAFINITANTILDHESKNCAQEALNILFTKRMVNNEQNMRLMKEFGYNNSQQIDCFDQIFARIPQIFKINLVVNLATLHELNLSALNSESLTFWLHLTALLLPQHDTSIQQTQLILKFLDAAIQARSIASLHYMQTLVQQVLYEVKDGISTTYLWKFIEQSKQISFQQFLSYIIQYSMKILIIPNYALIQHCLQLFKSMFTKLCKYRHKSFNKYFQIIESVCRQIDKTMLVKPQYIKLRINFFSIISIIWVNEGQISFVYRILNNIRSSLGQHPDYIHFLRYLTDITGLLQPVQSSQVYKLLLQLVLVDMQKVLPFYLGTLEKISAAFSQQIFLKTFVKFIYTIVNDNGFRLTNDSHTQLPFQIEQTFSPYLLQVIKYDYPVKTVQTWLKFIKLNPLGKLLPLQKSFKQKNSPHYKSLIREYFQNLHRLQNIQQFYTIYTYIDDNIDLMVDWWQQIMIRGYKPNINVRDVVNARLCVNSRQKQHFAKLLFRIAKYDQNYWRIQCDATTESKYADWFVANYR